MRLLLDTHVVLWWLESPQRLSDHARDLISDSDNVVYVSTAVAWEIAIKRASGKLTVNANIDLVLARSGFEWLPITEQHAWATETLPMLHRDPFDRLLVAQAIIEDATIVTRDDNVRRYAVSSILA